MNLRHVLVDGGVSVNILSMYVINEMQILNAELTYTYSFVGISSGLILLIRSIKLLVTLGTRVNFQ